MTSSENSSSIFLFYTKQESHSYILQNRSSTSDEIYVARNETALESGFFFFWENWKRLHIRMALVATSFSQKINITHQERQVKIRAFSPQYLSGSFSDGNNHFPLKCSVRKGNQDESLPESITALIYGTIRSRGGLLTPFLGSFGNSIANLSFTFVVVIVIIARGSGVVSATCAGCTFSLDFQRILHKKL
jgi:hypothetical protein